MDDKDWLIVKTVAEEKNITKAADRLYISQPALTYRLKNLEKEFGAKLVSRNPNGVQLTHQGEFLLAYAKEMLLRFRDAKELIKNMENKVQGTLRLGTSAIFAHFELPQILKAFLDRYPEVEISLKTGLSYQVHHMMQLDEISIAIIRGDYLWAEEKHLIHEEPICLVAHEPIELKDLPHKPQITYMTDSSLRPVVEDWWRQSFEKPPLITMAVDSMDTCRQMVVHGLGCAILPETGLKAHKNLFRQNLRWPNGQPLLRRTWMIYHSSSLELSAVKAFVEFIRAQFRCQ
jgi:DNA-binding transcriptional LysR family regulator